MLLETLFYTKLYIFCEDNSWLFTGILISNSVLPFIDDTNLTCPPNAFVNSDAQFKPTPIPRSCTLLSSYFNLSSPNKMNKCFILSISIPFPVSIILVINSRLSL